MSLTVAPCCGIEHICHVDSVTELKEERDAAESALRQVREDLTALAGYWANTGYGDTIEAVLARVGAADTHCTRHERFEDWCGDCQTAKDDLLRATTNPADPGAADMQPEGVRCRICGGENGQHDGATHDARVADMPLPTAGSEVNTASEACPCCGSLRRDRKQWVSGFLCDDPSGWHTTADTAPESEDVS